MMIVIAFLTAEKFNRTIGDDFIEVHVGGCSRAALQGVHGELIGKTTGRYFITGLLNDLGFFGGKMAGFGIGQTAGLFYLGQERE